MSSEFNILTKKERSKQHQDLIAMFPEIHIAQPSHQWIKKKGAWSNYIPFDLETGRLAYGDYKGKTLDEVLDINPAYIIRMTYYSAFCWEPLHKLHFIKWTKELDTRKEEENNLVSSS